VIDTDLADLLRDVVTLRDLGKCPECGITDADRIILHFLRQRARATVAGYADEDPSVIGVMLYEARRRKPDG